jgi:hypothetical protein
VPDRHPAAVVRERRAVEPIHKYPRTPHLAGSRLQPGDHDLEQVPLEALTGRFVVVEEKLDGANAGIALMGKCLTMGTPDDLVAHLKRFHTYIDGVHWDELRAALEQLAVKFRARDASTLDYGQMFNELFAIGRRYHVRPVTDLTLVLVAMVTSQGIGSMLDPGVNVFSEVAR